MSQSVVSVRWHHRRLPGVLVTLAVLLGRSLSAASSPASTGPLVVDNNSRVAVMEYEAWFGPNAVTSQGSAAMPLLQCAAMQPLGGGYDSADPAVIRQHVAWFV